MKVVTITGYKPIELSIFKPDDPKIIFIKETIKKRLIPFIEDGLKWVLISGQMGVEMWTGEVIMDLKDTYDIKLGVIPAFEKQEERWPEAYQNTYQKLVMGADFHQSIYQSEYKGPFQFKARDKWLIDKSAGAIVLFDEEQPGSPAFFLEEAHKLQKENYPVYYITPFDLEETVNELEINNSSYWSQDF